MNDLITRCEVCRGLIDEEDLFCANCGTEAPHRAHAPPPAQTNRHSFQCQGCGASMSYDASAQSLRCPFCGSVDLKDKKNAKVLAPNSVIPFRITRDQADVAMRKWLGSSFWRPGDLAKTAQVTKMTPVYVPYWVFEAQTHTYWTADSSSTPMGARGDWHPLFGEHRGAYRGLLVGASGALTQSETAAISPFNLSDAVEPEQVNLEDVTVEEFGLARKYARPRARQGIEALEARHCQQYVPGSCRNMNVNVRVSEMSSEPVLLPVWIMAYRYRDKVYRFLVNGQNGRATGKAPVSWPKILAAVALGVLFVFFVLFMLLVVLANA